MRKVLGVPLFFVAALFISCGGSNSNMPMPVSTQAAQKKAAFLYATDTVATSKTTSSQAIEVFQFDSNSGKLTLVAGSPFLANGSSPAISSDNTHLYLTGEALYVYALDANTGVPTLVQTIALSRYSGAAHVDPQGRFVYVDFLNQNNNEYEVNVYSVQTDGTLNFNGAAPVPANNFDAFISANGKFLYAYSDQPLGTWEQTGAPSGPALTTFWQYAIDPSTGMPTPIANPAQITRTICTAGRWCYNRINLQLSPDGTQAFGVDQQNGIVTIFATNPSTGKMAVVSSSNNPVPLSFTGSGLDPNGRLLYIAMGGNGLSGFNLPPSGGNTLAAIPRVAPPGYPANNNLEFYQPIVDVYGDFVLADVLDGDPDVCCYGNDVVAVYQINHSNGDLTFAGSVTLHGTFASLAMTQPH